MLSDLIEGPDSFILQVEIPGGKSKDDFDVQIEGSVLTVKAKPSPVTVLDIKHHTASSLSSCRSSCPLMPSGPYP